MDEEPWTRLDIHPPTSQVAIANFDYLFSNDDDECMAGAETPYIDQISTMQISRSGAGVDSKSDSKDEKPFQLKKGMSLTQLSGLPLPLRLCGILVNTQVINLAQIKRVLNEEIDELELVAALLQSSVLIRGVFVCKSSLMYTDRPLHARNYLLKLFLDSEHVARHDLVAVTHLVPDMAVNMLREIAVLESEGWKLKAAEDERLEMM
jgi:RPC5 protein